jgi:PIN domain nuclease of toxin-antitoxin system
MKAFLDTHAAVALAGGQVEVFGNAAKNLLERSALFISPIVRLELAFLFEIGRLSSPAEEVLGLLVTNCGVTESSEPSRSVVSEALDLTWTRDPFDRWIVATAKLHRAPLITKDEKIHSHYANAIW